MGAPNAGDGSVDGIAGGASFGFLGRNAVGQQVLGHHREGREFDGLEGREGDGPHAAGQFFSFVAGDAIGQSDGIRIVFDYVHYPTPERRFQTISR
jgi:hypothetical protein